MDRLTVLLVIVALGAMGAAIWRQSAASSGPAMETFRIEEWDDLALTGRTEGDPGAGVSIVQFTDFQCRQCERLRFTLDSVLARFPTQVKVVHRHYPMRMTTLYGDASANAAECAGEQGRFLEFSDALFDRQQYIGSIPWSEYAVLSGVGDLVTFDECVRGGRYLPRIERDAFVADSIGLFTLPTLVVNGTVFSGFLSTDALSVVVEDLLRELH